jgi:ATP-dependent helicase/nuclease subunit B
VSETDHQAQFHYEVAQPDAPAVTLPAKTRPQEARLVMATVDELRARGVPIRDILVVTGDIEQYEPALVRAAIRYGHTPTVWTHLPVVETQPYALCAHLCTVLGAAQTSIDTLCQPLTHGWCPGAPERGWPMPTADIRTVCRRAPAGEYTIGEWRARLLAVEGIDGRLAPYLAWLADQPQSPTPAAVTDTLEPVLDRYEEQVLPHIADEDTPALRRTERDVRALVRMEELLPRIRSKYDLWLADGRTTRSWATVERICELLATQYPGRREHGNARALDIIAANDAWGRTVPYVIAVGLSDGIWPRQPATLTPTLLQQRILTGRGTLAGLAPRPQWECLRQYDQFAETVNAATRGVILTRHVRTHEGIERAPSPLLGTIETTPVARPTAAGLVQSSRRVPAPLAALLPADQDTTTSEETHE